MVGSSLFVSFVGGYMESIPVWIIAIGMTINFVSYIADKFF